MARVVSEAMAAGLPCIITNSRVSLIYWMIKLIFYVDKNNIEQIYISLKEAILNPDRLNMLTRIANQHLNLDMAKISKQLKNQI